VDSVLKICYDHSNRRSIIFSSFHPSLCSILNWKQPNFGVFFRTFCGDTNEMQTEAMSIKESVKFCKSCDLIGLICESKPLVRISSLMNRCKCQS
jgi:Glycerophosphoryl diester phosphodiesterase family